MQYNLANIRNAQNELKSKQGQPKKQNTKLKV